MSRSAGDRLGPYEILAPIGKGGMGEVFRARDSRLNRDVAIKVSTERFSERFEREARAIAALNHPNICHLYDVGSDYLVMELVEGPTLAERLKEGALPLEESLNIARQMADALEAAHEKGITHRDLKPGNVKIKADGTVKVLDFGLAKMGGSSSVRSDESPTITVGQTAAGVILGTAAYMAPEQAKGKEVDKRADIYAFGLVFYEMLAGVRVHAGETLQETMASVLKDEPDLSQVPAQAHRLLRQCLVKDPQKRLRHIGDVMRLLDDEPVPTVQQTQSGVIVPPRVQSSKWLWPAVAAVLALAVMLAVWAPWRTAPSAQPMRFEVVAPEKTRFTPVSTPVVSPDGRWMVFSAIDDAGVGRYWIRSLDSTVVRPLVGTEPLAATPAPAFWSADSKYINYGRGNKIMKVDIAGGPPQVVGDAPDQQGAAHGAWNRDGVLIYGTNTTAIRRVSPGGGAPTPVTVLDSSRGETAHRWIQFLPDAKHFLYHRTAAKPENTGIYVGSLDVKPQEQSLKPLLITDRQAYYAPSPLGSSGYLVFLRDTTLFAQPFNASSLELSAEPVAVANGIGSFPNAYHGLFSVSQTGLLAYQPGGSGAQMNLTWVDLQGRVGETLGDPANYSAARVSPDGTKVAASDGPVGLRDIWIVDARGNRTRFTTDPRNDDTPVWSPDGKRIAFSSFRGGTGDLYVKPADGSSEERLLFKSPEPKVPTSWSPDGRLLLFNSQSSKTGNDIWVLTVSSDPGGEAKPRLLLGSEFNEAFAQFSPDGRWIAYLSNESGQPEVYVRPLGSEGSGSGVRTIVSKGGGLSSRWRADGRELLYFNLRAEQMAVDIDTRNGVQVGVPRRLFAAPLGGAAIFAFLSGWDVTRDGKRFLYVSPRGGGETPPFTVLVNWQAGLKK